MSLVYSHLLSIYEKRGGIYAVLLDPDKKNHGIIESTVAQANESDVDVLLVGGSLMMDGKNHNRIRDIKEQSKIPVVFFPGSASQLNSYYDAILFLSVLSGRNPHYLIGEQVISAPIIKDLGLETIPTGYLLLDGGARSTVARSFSVSAICFSTTCRGFSDVIGSWKIIAIRSPRTDISVFSPAPSSS